MKENINVFSFKYFKERSEMSEMVRNCSVSSNRLRRYSFPILPFPGGNGRAAGDSTGSQGARSLNSSKIDDLVN